MTERKSECEVLINVVSEAGMLLLLLIEVSHDLSSASFKRQAILRAVRETLTTNS